MTGSTNLVPLPANNKLCDSYAKNALPNRQGLLTNSVRTITRPLQVRERVNWFESRLDDDLRKRPTPLIHSNDTFSHT